MIKNPERRKPDKRTVDLEAKLKEAELKALESAYKLGIAQEEMKELHEKVDLYKNTLEAVKICSSIPVAIRIIDEVLNTESEPDITITCRNECQQDIIYCMGHIYPTKYKFLGHIFKDGTHTLTYRRA